jgi:hypothetical protein
VKRIETIGRNVDMKGTAVRVHGKLEKRYWKLQEKGSFYIVSESFSELHPAIVWKAIS